MEDYNIKIFRKDIQKDMANEFIWNRMAYVSLRQPVGKLKPVHFPGSAKKIYIDQEDSLFFVNLMTGEKKYYGSALIE